MGSSSQGGGSLRGILSGNVNNADGRIFSTTVIRYSINGGADFSLLGYFESAPLGSINNETGVPGSTEDHALHLEIFDDSSTVMLAGVTNLQFDFYAVDNTQGQYRDPFDGVNPFTEIDDGLTAAISSPLIWEIDVIGQSGVGSADFDGNQVVDGKDFLIWQRGFGGVGSQTTGDANGDLAVNGDDLTIWKNQFGGTAISAIWRWRPPRRSPANRGDAGVESSAAGRLGGSPPYGMEGAPLGALLSDSHLVFLLILQESD